MAYPILYELNTRCWLRELSAAAGWPLTLSEVPTSEFERWQQLGFTHIWLMGVWTTGPRVRQQALSSETLGHDFDQALPIWTDSDVTGSPYAIADYTVAAELGGGAALKKFRGRLHEHGLKLILDFVPNHLGLDHAWLAERPELFVQADSPIAGTMMGGPPDVRIHFCHGRDPFFPPWTDTVQLDYRRADTRAAMTKELLRVAALCDGVRCDMAMLLLNDVFAQTWREHSCQVETAPGEFWKDAIAATRKRRPGFLFIAEAYWNRERELLNLGFDFAYHKTVTDVLCDSPENLHAVLQESADWLARGVHFLENHDEPRVAGRLVLEAHRAAALATLALPGLRFLHEGQLEGWRVRTPVQLGRRQLEITDLSVRTGYERLLSVLSRTRVGHGQGEVLAARSAWDDNPTARWFVLVQWQERPDEFHLVVVNLSSDRSQCYAPLTVASLAARDWQLFDLLGDEGHERAGQELAQRGLYLDVPAHATQIFQFRPLAT